MTKLTEEQMRALATDIARDLFPVEDVLKQHNVKAAEYQTLADTPAFVRMVAAAAEVWNSASSADERVRVKAALISEAFLPEAARLLHEKSQPLASRTDLFKTINKMAASGFAEKPTEVSGEGVTITINLGGDKPIKIVSEAPTIIEHEPDDILPGSPGRPTLEIQDRPDYGPIAIRRDKR